MSNESCTRGVPRSPPCCTCDGEEGPCAVPKVVLFPVQEQDAALEPALVLQGQPLHQQRSVPGQRHAAFGEGREGCGGVTEERAEGRGWKVNARGQTGVVSRCRTRAHKAGGQASSVTKATVKVKDSTALMDKKFVTEHTDSVDLTDGAGNWGGTLNSCAERSQQALSTSAKAVNHWSGDGNHQRYKLCPVIKVMGTGGGLGSACQKYFI